ncbi:MAG: LysM peptidoglycan-binding domain-containing protein [Bacteroidota bacterium]
MRNFQRILLLIVMIGLSVSNSFAQGKSNTHTVKTGETVRSIAKKYKITPYDLIKINPDVKDPPVVGSKIIIPAQDGVSDNLQDATEGEKRVGDKVYHKVAPKETLYSLSKKYNVEIKDLYEANPSLVDGLKIGMTLLIPSSKKVVEVKRDASKFILHVIEPKETRWGLCHKYGITEEELIENNPKIAQSVNIGDTVWIPKSNVKEIVREEDINYNYTYYEVKPKDTNYGLSKKFGVDISVLKKENPNIAGGLQIGMVLKIPKAPREVYDTSKFEQKTYTNLPNDAKLSSKEKIEELDKFDIPRVVDVVMMLPFYLDKNAEIINDNSSHKEKTKSALKEGVEIGAPSIYPKSAIALDFYNGAMFAIDSLKRMGLSVRLRVFDTHKNLEEVKRILDNNDFSEVDVVIGPLYTENVEYVADRLKYDNVLVVSPLSKKLDLDNRFNLVQAMPTSYTTKNSVIKEIINGDSNSSNILIFGGLVDKAEVDFVESRLKSSLDSNKVSTYIAEENLVDREVVFELLEPNKDNVVVMASKSNVLITDVITALNQVTDSLPNRAFLLSRPKILDQLESDYLNTVSLTYPEDYFVDYEDAKAKEFDRDFKQKNKYLPSVFAYRGFDVTYDVLFSLGKSSNLEVGILQNNKRCVQGKFNYSKKPFGGYYNNSVFVIKYNNWRLEEVNN